MRVYKVKNAEKVKSGLRSHYRRNADRIKRRMKGYAQANKDKIRKRQREYFQKTKPKRLEKIREWQLKNPEKFAQMRRLASLNRIARKRNAEGSHSLDDIRRLYCAQNGQCVACARELADGYHVDHIVALKNGGSNWPDNLQLLCPNCNCQKSTMSMEEFMFRKRTRES